MMATLPVLRILTVMPDRAFEDAPKVFRDAWQLRVNLLCAHP